MIIRNGFITNSSSSSFILIFKNNDKLCSYNKFKKMCNFLNYKDFYKLINNIKKNKDNINKEKSLELLYNYYSYEYREELINSKLNKDDYETYIKYLDARNAFIKSNEFKEKIKKYIEENNEYQKKKKQIEDADLVVKGMIWDTDGGTLECAIRNGFIEDNFSINHIITWNIG